MRKCEYISVVYRSDGRSLSYIHSVQGDNARNISTYTHTHTHNGTDLRISYN